MTNLYERYVQLADAYARAGEPPVSDYWRDGARAFYGDEYRERIEMVGRGGDKSRDIVRSAIVETLCGPYQVPASERHYFAIVSENMTEAQKTIRLIGSYLQLLGVPHDATTDTIELRDMNRGIKVFACRVGAVSGFRCFGWAADEAAKWRDAEGANPAQEVISSIRAMTVTHPTARGRMYSSPLGQLGYFYETHASGTTARTLCRHAATWQANPSVSEEATRSLERDPRVWAREYAAIPQAGALGAFDLEAVDRAMRERNPPPTVLRGAPLIVIDASSGRSDSWTWACVRWLTSPSRQYRMVRRHTWIDGDLRYWWDYDLGPDGKPIEIPPPERFPACVQVAWIRSVDGSFWKQTSAEQIVDAIARDVAATGAVRVIGDQRESFTLQALFAQRRIAFTSLDWTNPTKTAAVETLRRWLRDGDLWLPKDDVLRAELAAFEERITASGAITFGARRGHDDRVALLLTLAMAEGHGLLPSSPIAPRVVRDLTLLPAR